MNNAVVIKKVMNANFEATHEVTGILFNNFTGKVKEIFDCIFVSS